MNTTPLTRREFLKSAVIGIAGATLARLTCSLIAPTPVHAGSQPAESQPDEQDADDRYYYDEPIIYRRCRVMVYRNIASKGPETMTRIISTCSSKDEWHKLNTQTMEMGYMQAYEYNVPARHRKNLYKIIDFTSKS